MNMAQCGRYVLFMQRAVSKGSGHLSQIAFSKKTQQHCYRCLGRQQTVPWTVCTVRTFFSFFRSGKNKELEQDRPTPTYPVIQELGKVSPRRMVPAHINKPEWAETGQVAKKPIYDQILDTEEQEEMRVAGRIARKILDIGASELKVGVTTDYIDEVVHNACIEHNVYPSPLNYYNFPKSVCTSINNVMVHGIPDDRPLHDGDIITLDVTICKNGFHADLSQTYQIGEVDAAGKRLVEVAKKCRDEAIMQCGPNIPISIIGNTIEEICVEEGMTVCHGFDGHGIGRHFHCKPHIWHYRNNYPEVMKPGMTFTVEPVIMERPDITCRADDDWTMFAQYHTRSAQFEHTILITQNGFEVLTIGENENLTIEEQPPLDGGDDIIKGQSSGRSSNWTFK
ncbi:methionine aminopeptidase 1D, mitochondrial-like [Amphiura filiformis]|uniref:methionine aminopeptidase 1D, mitochondrial-like n=1 Tax=Amphiura filiformis TaxID=82378 RepID=UPI003B228E7B